MKKAVKRPSDAVIWARIKKFEAEMHKELEALEKSGKTIKVIHGIGDDRLEIVEAVK